MGRFADRRVHSARASPIRRALCSQTAVLRYEDWSQPAWSRCCGYGSGNACPGAIPYDCWKAKSATPSDEGTGLENVWARIALWLPSFAALLAWRTGGRQYQGLMEEMDGHNKYGLTSLSTRPA